MTGTVYHNSIRLLLAAAAIHMLGACPCGCLENNGWYLTAVSLFGSPTSSEPHEEPCDGDHPGHDVMIVSERGAASGKAASTTSPVFPPQFLHPRWAAATLGAACAADSNLTASTPLGMPQVLRL
ncbi:MAG: hypothetical protein KDA37_17180 [Planctomycetales bacterium]|nr:hypothetical protein [Planctomycetales bacterium]